LEVGKVERFLYRLRTARTLVCDDPRESDVVQSDSGGGYGGH